MQKSHLSSRIYLLKSFCLKGFFILILCLSAFANASVTKQNESDQIIPSLPEEIGALLGYDQLIEDVVSPLTGQPCFQQVDLVAKGAEDIILNRSYLSTYMPASFTDKKKLEEYALYEYLQSQYKGWVYFPHQIVGANLSNRWKIFCLKTPNGAAMDFRLADNNSSSVEPINEPYGISNLGPDGPSGKYDLRNIRITTQDNFDNITVQFPDGATRHYRKIFSKGRSVLAYQTIYRLEKEIKPNGKVLKFYYANGKDLSRVESMDPLERVVYASIDISHTDTDSHFSTHTGKTANYHYYEYTLQGTYKKQNYKIKSPSFLWTVKNPFSTECSSYDSRLLLSRYVGYENQFGCNYDVCRSKEKSNYKVKALTLPAGQTDDFIPVYEFSYDPAHRRQQGGLNKSEGS